MVAIATVVLLSAYMVLVTAIAPIEEFHIPKPYSFGYAIKDKHGEQNRQEVGDGLHSVRGSYGFKDERGIERQVNYIADEGGFRAEVKTNEPGTAPLNPAAVKMESSAHPYYGISKGPIAAESGKKGFASGFGLPGVMKLDPEELAKAGFGFDSGLAKENELEKEGLSAKLMKSLGFGTGFGLEKLSQGGYGFAPIAAEKGLVKEAEAAKGLGFAAGFGLEELLKSGFALVPVEAAAKEATLEKEGLALEKLFGSKELAKLGLLYSPLLSKEKFASGLKEEFKKRLGFGELAEAYPYIPKFAEPAFSYSAPLPYAAPKPKGFLYGGPIKGGIVKGYDARFY